MALGSIAITSALLLAGPAGTHDIHELVPQLASPSEFDELPGQLQAKLVEQGCEVPQPWLALEFDADFKPPVNVIQGEFLRAGQTDWAVLCSRGGMSSVLVFWAGSASHSEELAPAEDRSFFQAVTADGLPGYSRLIVAVGPEAILRYQEAHAGPEMPPGVGHEGIEDHFLEKGSVIHYFREGNWLQLAGAD